MALEMELSPQLQQKLSPQMIQNLQLAAMPLLELQQRVQEELVANPVLEMHEDAMGSDPKSVDKSAYDEDLSDREDDPSSYESRPEDGTSESTSYDEEASDRAMEALENTPSQGESLEEHLLGQLRLERLSPDEMQTGRILLSDLDGNGFWKLDPKSILPSFLLPHLDKVSRIISRLEPVGCAVPSWRESLIVQSEEREDLDDEERRIIGKMVEDTEALTLLSQGKYDQASQRLACLPGQAERLFQVLKTFTLFPGRSYDSGPTLTVTPDFSIHAKEGELVLDVNDEAIPPLTLDESYLAMAKETKDKQTKNWLNGKIKDAKALIDQVQFRYSNLEKLGRVLCVRQSEFFFHGWKYLKPLTQRQVAEDMQVSEPTVSRLASSKYVDTDWGILSLKSLFSSGVDGESKASVQSMIKDIIASYTGKKKLSDQKISDMLAEKGVKIARRTVAKYRGEMS